MRAWVLRYWSSPGIGIVRVDGRSPDGGRLHVAKHRAGLPKEWFERGEWTSDPAEIGPMVQRDAAQKLAALKRRVDEIETMSRAAESVAANALLFAEVRDAD